MTENATNKKGGPPKQKETEADNTVETGKEITKRKSNAGNPALVGDKALNVKPGDNAQYLGHSLAISALPKVDLTDGEAVENRVREYFQICADWDVKPTVSGFGMALGMDRRRLWEVKSDVEGRNVKLPPRARDSIKKAYIFLENLWENYMLNYKIHPTAGIFLGKNNFGYKDEQTYNLVPNNPLGSDTDPTTLVDKYKAALPGSNDSDEEK